MAPSGKKECCKWYLTAASSLSDGSIIYATDKRDSGIHIGSDQQHFFSIPTNDRKVTSFQELPDGSVIAQCTDSTLILRPKIEGEDYEIEKLELELKHHPDQLELYGKLTELYGKANMFQKQYQTYLAGIGPAVRQNKIYQARRFYEKARQIEPKSEEPCHVFLACLEHATYKEARSQAFLDLSYLQKASLSPKPCRKRLFVGEGPGTYTEAIIKKHKCTHPSLAKAITATELTSPRQDSDVGRYRDFGEEGVAVQFGVDATKLDGRFKEQHFSRIHWNCPYGDKKFKGRKEFQLVIPKFFKACARHQKVEDRVHVSLIQDGFRNAERQLENPIVEASASAGYRLIRKRSFDEQRYPGYKNIKTSDGQAHTDQKKREFVFELTNKRDLPDDIQERALALKDDRKKSFEVKRCFSDELGHGYYFECTTDEDSSDYYESDSD